MDWGSKYKINNFFMGVGHIGHRCFLFFFGEGNLCHLYSWDFLHFWGYLHIWGHLPLWGSLHIWGLLLFRVVFMFLGFFIFGVVFIFGIALIFWFVFFDTLLTSNILHFGLSSQILRCLTQWL